MTTKKEEKRDPAIVKAEAEKEASQEKQRPKGTQLTRCTVIVAAAEGFSGFYSGGGIEHRPTGKLDNIGNEITEPVHRDGLKFDNGKTVIDLDEFQIAQIQADEANGQRIGIVVGDVVEEEPPATKPKAKEPATPGRPLDPNKKD